MKQLIVTIAVFILLMAIIIQIPLEMVNYERRHAVMFYVNNAKEMAKQEGYYTEEILDKLKEDISTKFKINKSQIEILDHTNTPKYRLDKFRDGELIYLKIRVPFDRIIAAASLFGLDDSGRGYVIEVSTTSERLVK